MIRTHPACHLPRDERRAIADVARLIDNDYDCNCGREAHRAYAHPADAHAPAAADGGRRGTSMRGRRGSVARDGPTVTNAAGKDTNVKANGGNTNRPGNGCGVWRQRRHGRWEREWAEQRMPAHVGTTMSAMNPTINLWQ